jgi:exonuclease SbcD
VLRLLHTSDWHLGHTLHGLSRTDEHAAFLAWLEERVVADEVDALIITGDTFDTTTPPASAERALFDLLARLRVRAPRLQVVIIGGNHDSPARLEAPAELLRALDVRVVASLGRRPGQPLDPDRLVLPLRDRAGQVAAWLAAVPFLRPADLPPRTSAGSRDLGAAGEGTPGEPEAGEHPDASATDGLRPRGRPGSPAAAPRSQGDELAALGHVYREVLALARARRAPGQALLATGHLCVRGALPSGESERAILGGHAPLDTDLFPPELAYVALGHLHKAQPVGGREHVRYAGSPIPLSLTEADYRHQVVRVDLEGERVVQLDTPTIPRTLDVLRLPAAGPGAPDEVLALLAALPTTGSNRPLLEVRIRLEAADPSLRRKVEEALEGKAARLVRLSVTTPEAEEPPALADGAGPRRLLDLAPREVLLAAWRREHEADPPPDVLAAFDELLAGPAPVASPVAAPEGVEAA